MVNLARGFAERGLKVDLALVRAEGPYLAEVPKEVRVVDLKAKRELYSIPGLVRYMRRERPEVMLSTLNHSISLLSGREKLLECRSVWLFERLTPLGCLRAIHSCFGRSSCHY